VFHGSIANPEERVSSDSDNFYRMGFLRRGHSTPRRRAWLPISFLLTLLGAATIPAGCGEEERPRGVGSAPPPQPTSTATGCAADAGWGGDPPLPDAAGYCGNEVHAVTVDVPNLYFILDASGSMAEEVPSGGNRYDAVRIAVMSLVKNLGPRVKIGAALLPDQGAGDQCAAGVEVFPVTQGDPITECEGEITRGFRLATITKPNGGTPISATIEALTPSLLKLSGETYVVIATDGGPNCNEGAACSAAECSLNIEHHPACDPAVNCCAPGQVGGPSSCIDQTATVAAIDKLAQAGIHVVTVGIPGSETYADVLDAMAVVGGLPRPDSPKYYRVDQLEELGPVLNEVVKVTGTCDFVLDAPPQDSNLINVYLDDQVLPAAPVDGWVWMPPATVRLLGKSCDRVLSGQVADVQIVVGCPTEVPK
jgi:hypothetical protein